LLTTALGSAAFIASAMLTLPTVLYALECAAGSLPFSRGRRTTSESLVPLTVLVPAHDEENGIVATLFGILRQLHDGDRLVVVADNCRDRTAALARSAGAEVVERFDEERRGKGFALDAGIRYLEKMPPEIVIVMDADCCPQPGALDRLRDAVVASGRPVQARYLMKAPADATMDFAVAEFAFLVKNQVRPSGMAKLGLPCQLTGTGMAFPWALLSRTHLAHANLVEDMKLGLDLARAGHPPQFLEDAVVTSLFPYSAEGAKSQRRRWEGGHLAMSLASLRSLLDLATWRNPAYLFLLLDVLIPPLTLLGFLLVSMVIFATALASVGIAISPLVISAMNLFLLIAATGAAWLARGRQTLPADKLRRIPRYALGKLTFYPRAILRGAGGGWIRTDRNKPTQPNL
jgi:cellulose synthase/poly-beta-1,6-N-acetylglucosamine synthase-like glycosyltransferase